MQVYLHIYSQISGRICFNSKHDTILEEQTKIKIKIKFLNNFYFEFTPINSNIYSNFLCEILTQQNTLYTSSKNIHIIKLDDINYYIIIQPPRLSSVNILSNSSQEINLKNKKIIYNLGKLEIIDKNKYNSINISNNARHFKLIEQNGIIFLISNDNQKNNLHIINFNLNHIETSANKYQIKDNEIQCINNLKTFAKHQKITCYDTNTLNITREFIGYKHKPNIDNLPKKVLPFAFMQCIQVQDYTLAQSFLDPNTFTGKLTKIKAQSFFENFYLICTPQIKKADNTICLLYKNNNKYSCKYFTFEFNNNNKITNIKPCN